jgi:Mg2+ and Co2+ transporter CorA
MEETREKIELFRNYYLVCFRGFDQDPYSPTYLEPLNMYIIVFREGTLSVSLLDVVSSPAGSDDRRSSISDQHLIHRMFVAASSSLRTTFQ